MNKIKLKNTPQQVELIQAMADKNPEIAMKARQAFANFVGPVIQQVLDLAPISPMLYSDWSYDEDDDPSLPLDMFYGTSVDHVTVWYQSIAGGLGSSLVTGLQELKFSPYHLDSAVSLIERNVKRGRLPVVSLALNRLANELVLKQERNAMLVVLKALGEAQTGANKHVIAANTANVLQLDDFNNLLTRSKRINVAFDGAGTSAVQFSRGATDMLLSCELMEEIRSFAYQPMNTRGVPNSDESTAVPLPDSVRAQIYNNSGAAEIYGVRLHEALEFGVGQTYNVLFDQFDSAIPSPAGTFTVASEEIAVAWDATREVIIRPIATNADTGSNVTVNVDDSFTSRSGKIGWYAGLTEARIVLDSRSLTGIVV